MSVTRDHVQEIERNMKKWQEKIKNSHEAMKNSWEEQYKMKEVLMKEMNGHDKMKAHKRNELKLKR